MISVQNLILFSFSIQFLNCIKVNEIGLNTTDNLLFIDNHEVTIHQNEMSTEMTADIVGHSTSAIDKTIDDENLGKNIKMFMEKEFNGTWLVMVDKNFTSYIKIPHLHGTYISFSYKNRTVAALKLTSVN